MLYNGGTQNARDKLLTYSFVIAYKTTMPSEKALSDVKI